MERFDCSLWEYLKKNSDSIPMDERLKMLKTLLDAALFIQNNNFCHLDLKPANIFINVMADGSWDKKTLKIADFGLARKSTDLIGSMGTPAFGSPEQFEGRPDLKSDNFAIGRMAIMILYPWDIAWHLIAQPLSAEEYNNHPARIDEKCQIIAGFLEVSK